MNPRYLMADGIDHGDFAPSSSRTTGVSGLKNDLIFAAVRLLLGLGRWLPLRASLALGRLLGWLGYFVAPRERARTVRNLRTTFPALGDREVRRLARGCFANLGETAAEIALLPQTLRHAEVDYLPGSLETLREALREERGVLFVSAHLGNWEILAAHLASLGIPATVVSRPLYDPRISALLNRLRHAVGVAVIERGTGHRRQMLAALREGRAVGVLLDHDTPRLPTQVVPFFGRPAGTVVSPIGYAARRGIPLLFGFAIRTSRLGYRAEIRRLPAQPLLVNRAIEDAISQNRDQWTWMHNRWNAKLVPTEGTFSPKVSDDIVTSEGLGRWSRRGTSERPIETGR